MKKSIFLLCAVSLLSAMSCTKGFDAKEESASETYTYTVTAASPHFEMPEGTKADMVAIAKAVWKKNDCISVINVSTGKYLGDLTATSVTESGVATFTGDISTSISNSDIIAYVYPKLESQGEDFTSYEQSLATQSYNGGTSTTTLCAYSIKAAGVAHTSTLSFTLATSYVNLNLANLPSNLSTINKVTISDINDALVWKIEGGEFKLGTPETTNRGITVNVSDVTVSDNHNAIVRFAVPQSAEATSRTLTINGDLYEAAYPKGLRESGKFYNQIISSFEVAPPYFIVSSTGKRVKFSPGNLYWDGTNFKFEDNQYDYSVIYKDEDEWYWNPEHVCHFYWSKDASVAYSQTYSDSQSAEDVFFCAESKKLTVNGQPGWYALSSDEWTYLLNRSSSLYKYGVKVCGKTNCLILAPDGFSGTIADSYDASTWPAAEVQGLICLPAAGYRSDLVVGNAGTNGYYWSSTPNGTVKAYELYCDVDGAYVHYNGDRIYGEPIRLVRE